MRSHRLRVIGLIGFVALLTVIQGAVLTYGQDSPPADSVSDSSQDQSGFSDAPPPVPDHIRPQANYPQRRRSVVHHYPYPYPGYYNSDESAGFRNPGSVGRYAEYYPPGETESQLEREHVPAAPPVARFDTNPATNRDEQIRATQVGIQRYNSIQNHIDQMARPTWGYGFGVGGFGGFW